MRLARFVLAALAIAFAAAAPSAAARPPPQPVVVELFTSEGCGACPPADALLDRLAHEQPVPGAEVVALELHVDYFDRAGKADPYAQAAFGARQADYIRSFGKKGAYTPQMVVDGQREIVGARERETHDAVTDAARAPKAKVQLSRDGDKLSITANGLAELGGSDVIDVMLAITEDGLSGAATAAHGPVVRELKKIVSVAGNARGPLVVKDVELSLDAGWRRDRLRAVAFLQRSKSLEIVGAGVLALK
jgi:hypothetical protein